jgi:hypothetical protein
MFSWLTLIFNCRNFEKIKAPMLKYGLSWVKNCIPPVCINTDKHGTLGDCLYLQQTVIGATTCCTLRIYARKISVNLVAQKLLREGWWYWPLTGTLKEAKPIFSRPFNMPKTPRESWKDRKKVYKDRLRDSEKNNERDEKI